MKSPLFPISITIALLVVPALRSADKPTIPDWAWPGTATHQQVPPPADFHRTTRTTETPIGVFAAQSDIGGPFLAGSASFDTATGRYTITSASYNIWYTRDEFRYLWKKMAGDVSLAADVTFPNPEGYSDRKAVLVIRQDLDDGAKEIMSALHGRGLIHLALRPEKNIDLQEAVRLDATPTKAGERPIRIGIEKHGDEVSLWVSVKGEPMHAVGAPAKLSFDGPFYVGIGFCSHVPDKEDTTILSNVVLENAAGEVH